LHSSIEILGYVLSVCIGIILGLLGGGGSILSIPILVYFFHLDAVVASAYSLFIVGVTSLVGTIPKYKEQLVSMRAALLFGVPSLICTFATRKWLIPSIPDVIIQTESFVLTKRFLVLGTFAVLMIMASLSMVTGRREKVYAEHNPMMFLTMVEGCLIGLLTGLVGAGGGFLIIPALVFLTGLPFKTAVGTSLLVIAINSLIGFLGDVLNYAMDWPFLLLVSALAIVGIFIGNRLSHAVTNQNLRRSFGWFVLVAGIVILLSETL
jgi:uncharacterized membrane protein YfcA